MHLPSTQLLVMHSVSFEHRVHSPFFRGGVVVGKHFAIDVAVSYTHFPLKHLWVTHCMGAEHKEHSLFFGKHFSSEEGLSKTHFGPSPAGPEHISVKHSEYVEQESHSPFFPGEHLSIDVGLL